MKLLLFGGTFDPPHIGHMNLLRGAMQAVQPDLTIVMPAGVPPHKAASMTPGMWRYEMCACFLALEKECGGRIEISDWEIHRQGRNYTIDTVTMLEQKSPGAELYLSVGSDMLLTFTEWRRWPELLQKATLVVESRCEGDMGALHRAARALSAEGGRIVFSQAKALPMASSDIRAGKAPAEALPPETERIAGKYHLYGRGLGMTEQKARRLAKKRLSAKRYQHTLNVRRMAVKLAKRWGADPEKAALAALLHDTAKELPREEMLQILKDNAIMAENAQNRPSPVWHGICAAILAQTQWGVEDEEVLSAIRCHTTGKPGMSLLDEIVFLADMTSAERDYPEVDYLRKLEKEDIHRAMREALEMNLHWLEESGKPVDEETRAALEDLRQRERNAAHE